MLPCHKVSYEGYVWNPVWLRTFDSVGPAAVTSKRPPRRPCHHVPFPGGFANKASGSRLRDGQCCMCLHLMERAGSLIILEFLGGATCQGHLASCSLFSRAEPAQYTINPHSSWWTHRLRRCRAALSVSYQPGSQALSLDPPPPVSTPDLGGMWRPSARLPTCLPGRLSRVGFAGAEPHLSLFIHVSLLWLGPCAAGHCGLSGVRCPVSPT